MMRFGALLALWLCAVPAVAEPARPTLVSLDYCADQFVLALADPEQILALSKDATKPFSHLRDKAEGYRQVRAVAEDVIALQPDMVVRSWGGDARALAFYARFGIETAQLGYATDIEATADITRELAAAFGQAERGDALIAAMPPAAGAVDLTSLYVTPGGVTAGRGTMVDSLMQRAGIKNAVDGLGWQSLPLEKLVLNPPGLVLTAFFGFDTDTSDQWSAARHPALKQVLNGADVFALDESRLTCPAWFMADEAAALRAALDGAR